MENRPKKVIYPVEKVTYCSQQVIYHAGKAIYIAEWGIYSVGKVITSGQKSDDYPREAIENQKTAIHLVTLSNPMPDASIPAPATAVSPPSAPPQSAASPVVLEEVTEMAPIFTGPGAPAPRAAAPTPATAFWKEARVYDAMSNALRRRMFYLLSRNPAGLTIEGVASRVRRKRSITSKHLAILRHAGLVTESTAGRQNLQHIAPSLALQPGAPHVYDTGWLVIRVPALRRVQPLE